MKVMKNFKYILEKNEKGLYLIEFVCTGNNGRSPMAEAVGNYWLKKHGFKDTFGFISSGTKVDAGNESIMPYEKAKFLLEHIGKRINLVNQDLYIDERLFNGNEGYREVISSKAKDLLVGILRLEDAKFRNQALFEKAIKLPENPKHQTIPRSDVYLVLGMEHKHVTQVNQIYDEAGIPENRRPLITTVSSYIGGHGFIDDMLGSEDIIPYRHLRDNLYHEIIPKIVTNFLHNAEKEIRKIQKPTEN